MADIKNVNTLEGAEAKAFADTHLEKVHVNPTTWEIEYIDPASGERWIMDFPQSDTHGGGPPRLRRKTLAEAQNEK